MIYKLVDKYDPILSQPAEKFDFDNPQCDPVELFENLKETMIANRGVGLAAPQVGIPLAVFVVGHPDDPDNVFPVFNPKIVDNSGEVYEEEGCLSFPGLFIKVKRPASIRARYTTHNGVTDTIKFGGFTARAFLHEYDHIIGRTFLTRASSFAVERAKKQKKKLDKLRQNNSKKIV
jgi:peptide deformylase